jgi:hypothetical protein
VTRKCSCNYHKDTQIQFVHCLSSRLGGNQRDKDREKAQKKLAQQNKGKKTDGVSHTKRAESYAKALFLLCWLFVSWYRPQLLILSIFTRFYRDAEIMRAKQAAKEAAKTAGGGASK